MPDVTVLMAIHNAMPHLPEAVESIRGQTLTDWRMVVVNDGSTDESVNYLLGLADPRIEIVHQENRGLGAALNHGLQHCDSPLIARMDGDDICYPTRFEEQVAFLKSNPNVGCVGTQIERLGSRLATGNSSLAIEHAQIYPDIARGVNQMYHPTIMCRTALMKQIGGYWENPRGEEWDLFLRLGEHAELANLNKVLLSYRIHTGSMTGQSVKEIRTWIDYACECSRRRREGLQPIEFGEYVDQLNRAAWPRRIARSFDMHGRTQYRIGLGERLGEHPRRGKMRIAYSALWSPALCWGRIKREFGRRFRSEDKPSYEDAAVNSFGEAAVRSEPDALKQVSLLGLPFHQVTMQQATDWIFQSSAEGRGGWVLTPNVDILRQWNQSRDFRQLIQGVTLCVADGMPLVWASRIAGTPLPQRINGTNLMRQLIADSEQRETSIFLLGGTPGTADDVATKMLEEHPNLRIAGTHCPPLGFENDPAEMQKIETAVVESEADLIFVALGTPKQERLIKQLHTKMPSAWWLGIGASFDFLSGRIPRAPRWMQQCGLEWVHRLGQEPRRLAHRYLVDDLPFAAGMFARCAVGRLSGHHHNGTHAGNLSLSDGGDGS